MALRLFRKGGYPDKHWKLGDRDLPDQHPMSAITGLDDIITTIGDNFQTINDMIEDNTTNINLLLDRSGIIVKDNKSALSTIIDKDDDTFACTKDDNILWRWDVPSNDWVAIGGQDETGVIYEAYKAVDEQQIFSLIIPYVPNTNSIEVYIEGVLLKSRASGFNSGDLVNGFDFDYIEIDPNTIFFVSKLEAGDIVTFKNKAISTQIQSKSVFQFTNKNNIICNHNLNTKYVHCSVYVNDIDITHQVVISRSDNNNITVISPTLITGEIIIS